MQRRVKLRIDLEKEYGIVLEGGGARGAYQIGVWKALWEAGMKIKGVAGTSVWGVKRRPDLHGRSWKGGGDLGKYDLLHRASDRRFHDRKIKDIRRAIHENDRRGGRIQTGVFRQGLYGAVLEMFAKKTQMEVFKVYTPDDIVGKIHELLSDRLTIG